MEPEDQVYGFKGGAIRGALPILFLVVERNSRSCSQCNGNRAISQWWYCVADATYPVSKICLHFCKLQRILLTIAALKVSFLLFAASQESLHALDPFVSAGGRRRKPTALPILLQLKVLLELARCSGIHICQQ